MESRRRGISCVQLKEGKLTGLATSCVGTVFENIIEGKVGETQVTGRKGRRHKQLLDNLKETEVYWTYK